MSKKPVVTNALFAGLCLVFVGAMSSSAIADGPTVLGSTQSGCAGTKVLHTLTAFYDNCACQPGNPAPTVAGCPITYVGITQQTGAAMAAVFVTTPSPTPPSIPCTPNPNPGCLPHPATGICQQQFQVSVMIPMGTPPGMATHQVNITIDTFPAVGIVTTNVLAAFGDCGAPTECGDNVREGSEICDGNDDAACPGDCLPDCTCTETGIPTVPALPAWAAMSLAAAILIAGKRMFGKRLTEH